MHSLCDALHLPYEPTRVNRLRLLTDRTASYRWTFVPLAVFLWDDLDALMFGGAGLTGIKSRVNTFLLAGYTLSFCLPLFFRFLPSVFLLYWVGVFGLIECLHSLPALHS